MHGQWRFAVVVAAATLVAFTVWPWLPPTDESQDAIKRTLVTYESLDSGVWHSERYGDGTLSAEEQDALLDEREEAWRTVAEGDALQTKLRSDPPSVRRTVARRRNHPDEPFVVAAGGDVVLFDVRRRTLRGELLVRAAVVRWVERSRWDAAHGELVDMERRVAESSPILDYTLRQVGDAWRVVAFSTTDEAPYSYDAATGETGTGP